MKRTYLGGAILYHIGKHQLSQAVVAQRSGITQPSLSRLISKGQRPEPDSLKGLCCCWPDEKTNLRVLIEHLRDEMVRAGHKGEGELQFRPLGPTKIGAEEDVALISQEVLLDSDLAALIHDLATLVRRAHASRAKARQEKA